MAIFSKTFDTHSEHAANAVKSGDLNVLATPALAAFMENTAFEFANQQLDEAHTTVGSELGLQHLAASAIGETVTIVIIALKEEGHKYDFRLEAYVHDRLVAKACHTRVRVNRQRFMQRLNSND
ncbi:thioesterase family protein [Streptococcus halichoeri]|uniref:thioesterase family protein n=1 Tax=Streptococcus halichoeri TaxID=254785 RepID=UPI00135A3142|nr:thioesterase family protein [Streptococcus halichoeri]